MNKSGNGTAAAVEAAGDVYVFAIAAELCAQNRQRLCQDMVEILEEVAGLQFFPVEYCQKGKNSSYKSSEHTFRSACLSLYNLRISKPTSTAIRMMILCTVRDHLH